MTRRNQKRFTPGNKRYHDNDQKSVKMLDMRRMNYFRYDAKEIFNSTNLEEKVWTPILASIVSKASRTSIKEANEYIYKLESEEILDRDIADALVGLLGRYKKWR